MCCKIKPFPPNGQKFCRFFSPFPHISLSPAPRRPAQSAAERACRGARKRGPSCMETMNEGRGRAAQDERKNFRGDAVKAEQGTERRKRINAKNAFCAPKSNPQSKKAHLMRSPPAPSRHAAQPRQPPEAARPTTPSGSHGACSPCLHRAAETRGERERKGGGK